MKYAAIVLTIGLLSSQDRAEAHVGVDDLTPAREATHRAVSNGFWSDAATWGAAPPPAGARVLIPEGILVVVDVDTQALTWVRVDGQLSFDHERRTGLTVDTIVVGPAGRLTMGTRAAPIRPDQSATLTIRSSGGPIDVARDPLQHSRGLVALGLVETHGAAKTHAVPVAQLPAVAATQLRLGRPPVGWRAGDRVVLTATAYGQDETFTVAAIRGPLVTLDRPVAHPRAFPTLLSGAPLDGLRLHLANLTRNVVIRTDPEYAGRIPHHGHVMLMHRGGHEIRWTEFRDLGRTTIDPVTDPLVSADGRRDPGLCPDGGIVAENVRGRYALHFHMAGPGSTPSVVEGASISVPRTSRLKVGLVNHSSHVRVGQSVSHNITGSHFMTEEGDEIGTFVDNLAIHSEGGNWRNELAPHDALVKGACPDLFHRRRWDVGSNGYGIWLNGGGVDMVGNVLAGQASAGGIIWARPLNYALNDTFTVLFPSALLRPHDPPDWYAGRRNEEMLPVTRVPGVVTDNVAYATGSQRYARKAGFVLAYHLSRQPTRFPDSPRTRFSRNLAWNTTYGLIGGYLSWVDIRDSTFVAGSATRRPEIGMALRYQSQGGYVVENVRLEGFPECIRPADDAGESSVFRNVTCDGRPFVP